MTDEIWKPIIDFPTYEVSNFGNVRSLSKEWTRINPYFKKTFQYIKTKPRLLKPYVRYIYNKPRYASVNLRKNGKTHLVRIHRLVLLAFKGIPEKNQVSCHNDGNPCNNHVDNLRWDSQTNNLLDMDKHGTRPSYPIHYGEKHHKTTLTEKEVRNIRQKNYYKGMFAELSKKYNVSKNCISSIYNKKTWKNLKD